MATDGASCEPDFSRAPEDAAGAPAEAAVIEVPGWARDAGLGAPRGAPHARALPGALFSEYPLHGVASSPEAGASRSSGLGISFALCAPRG